jgi:hypothetical protein
MTKETSTKFYEIAVQTMMNHKRNEHTGEECGRIDIKRIKEILERMASTLAKNSTDLIKNLFNPYGPKHVRRNS